MNLRRILLLVSTTACLAAVILVVVRRQQIADLRNEHQDGVVRMARANELSRRPTTLQSSHSPPVELLRLRNQVTQLDNRMRELAGVRSEHEQLRNQLAASKTNAAAVGGLPPGYVLRSRARLAGLATPEDTLQSFLWAVQNKDFATLVQTLTPDCAAKLQTQFQQRGMSQQDFFRFAESIPGVRILSQQAEPDGSIELKVEFIPGMSARPRVRLRQIGGMWKLEDLPR